MPLTRFDLGAPVAVAAVSIAALFAAGCSSPSGIADAGCNQTVLGTAGSIHPESSHMTCTQIRQMNDGVSPGGAPYFVESPLTGRLWKCRTRGSDKAAPLLRCELGERSFSIVADGTG